MRAGDAFLQLDSSERVHHTWVVISDPAEDAEQILLVNFTDAAFWPDNACEIRPGEHPVITKPTRVAYRLAEVKSLKQLQDSRQNGFIAPQGRVSAELLLRIRLGAWESLFIAYEHQDLLEEQHLGRDDLLRSRPDTRS